MRFTGEQAHGCAPRIRCDPNVALAFDWIAGLLEAPGRGFGGVDGRNLEVPRQQARLAVGGRHVRGPRVGSEVMVIAAGRQEERARVVPHHFVEAQTGVIERLGGRQVGDVQVHVAHHGARRHPGPGLSFTRSEEGLRVQRVGGHSELAVAIAPL